MVGRSTKDAVFHFVLLIGESGCLIRENFFNPREILARVTLDTLILALVTLSTII